MILFSNRISVGELSFDDFAYIFVLGACARSPSIPTLLFGRQVHCQLLKCGFASNIQVQTTIIPFYASNKDIEIARKGFDEMPVRSILTWNAMINGYSSQEKGEKCSLEAVLLLKDMLVDASQIKPKDTTMVCILSAASQLDIFETGVCIHGYIEKIVGVSDQHDVFIGTGLVDMYSKCGCLDSALSSFNRTEWKNVLTWTAMLTGLAFHGKAKQALELLDAMGNGIKPNEVTFTSLFSACFHSGLIEEGLYLFHKMESEFNVKPQMQHCSCNVDLLGHLKEAYEFIMRMSVPPPDAIL